jgi:hypothetical protein
MGKWRGQSGAALPYLVTEVSLKAASAASIHDEAQAPSPQSNSLREQKGTRQLLPEPSQKHIHSLVNKCR